MCVFVVNMLQFSIYFLCFDRKRERENKRIEMQPFCGGSRETFTKKQYVRGTFVRTEYNNITQYTVHNLSLFRCDEMLW